MHQSNNHHSIGGNDQIDGPGHAIDVSDHFEYKFNEILDSNGDADSSGDGLVQQSNEHHFIGANYQSNGSDHTIDVSDHIECEFKEILDSKGGSDSSSVGLVLTM